MAAQQRSALESISAPDNPTVSTSLHDGERQCFSVKALYNSPHFLKVYMRKLLIRSEKEM